MHELELLKSSNYVEAQKFRTKRSQKIAQTAKSLLNRGPEVGGSRGGRGSGVGVGNGVWVVVAALGEVILKLQHLRSLEGPFWREIRTSGGL